MKFIALVCTALVVSGCVVVPNDSASARRDRMLETRQTTQPVAPAPVGAPIQTQPAAAPVQRQPITPVQTRTVQTQPVQPVQTQTVQPGPVEASPNNPAPQIVSTPAGNGRISDEQDFEAVSERQSIESDAQRIETNRSRYTVIQPTELPSRTGNTPNIVDYALKTNNPVGVKLYRRILGNEGRAARKCAGFATSDIAQQEFLARGGPIRDPMGVDPDGDGFACRWDPTPFRQAVRG